MDNNNWDLHAVVRGCCSSTTTTTTADTADFDSLSCLKSSLNMCCNEDENFPGISVDPFEELHGACKPFLKKYNQPEPVITAPEQEKQPQIAEDKRKISQVGLNNSRPPKSKRRKIQHKKVCHVKEDALSSDIWAWRKYGQKPIKGSPYPRGYYKCSSSKGCLARKQVERNRSDPTMFIVSYTAEHNHPAPTHRNSLAGSTRLKPNATQVAAVGDEDAAAREVGDRAGSCSSPGDSVGSVEEEMNTESATFEDTLEDEVAYLSDMPVTDDFFEGLDDFSVPDVGDCFPDRFRTDFGMNWVVNGAAATAAGGG